MIKKILTILSLLTYSSSAFSFPVLFFVAGGYFYSLVFFLFILFLNFIKVDKFTNKTMSIFLGFLLLFFVLSQINREFEIEDKNKLFLTEKEDVYFKDAYMNKDLTLSGKDVGSITDNYFDKNISYTDYIINEEEFLNKKNKCNIFDLSYKNGYFNANEIVKNNKGCSVYLYSEKIGVLYLSNIINDKKDAYFYYPVEKVKLENFKVNKKISNIVNIFSEREYYEYLIDDYNKKHTIITNRFYSNFIPRKNNNFLESILLIDNEYYFNDINYAGDERINLHSAIKHRFRKIDVNITTENDFIFNILNDNLPFYNSGDQYKDSVIVLFENTTDFYKSFNKIYFENSFLIKEPPKFVYVFDKEDLAKNFSDYEFKLEIYKIYKFFYKYLYTVVGVFSFVILYFGFVVLLNLYTKCNNNSKNTFLFYFNFLVLFYLFSSLYFKIFEQSLYRLGYTIFNYKDLFYLPFVFITLVSFIFVIKNNLGKFFRIFILSIIGVLMVYITSNSYNSYMAYISYIMFSNFILFKYLLERSKKII